MWFILANFSDESVALIQWALEQEQIDTAQVLYVDPGSGSQLWRQRVVQMQAWLANTRFELQIIPSKLNFTDVVMERGEFPNYQSKWCATILKGLPLLEFLDTADPEAQATIITARRRAASIYDAEAPEYIERNEVFDFRTTWHPLFAHTDLERDALVYKAGFELFGHPSQECSPCVNADFSALKILEPEAVKTITTLEYNLSQNLYPHFSAEANLSIASLVQQSEITEPLFKNLRYLDFYYQGCGNNFACGL